MRSWYDLSKEERKKLEKEFSEKIKKETITSGLILGVLGGVPAVMIPEYLSGNDIDSIWMIISGIIIFVILICLITIENNAQKEFATWLEVSKNIKK